MRKDITVAAEVRTSRGKNEARRTRRAGRSRRWSTAHTRIRSASPSTRARSPRSSAATRPQHHLQPGDRRRREHPGDGGRPAGRSRQGHLLHADLKRIDLTKRIRVTVPVHTAGEPAGVKVQGGLLEVITRAIEIECLPDEIPESFTIDVSELMIGQSKRASDVALSGSMKLVSAAETVIAHIVALRAEEVAAAPEAAAAPEPHCRRTRSHQEGQEGRRAPAAEEKGKKK